MSDKNERCEGCRFWKRTCEGGRFVVKHGVLEVRTRTSDGICRRSAPTKGFGWPKTLEADWCGEFQPRSLAQPAPKEVDSVHEEDEEVRRRKEVLNRG